MRFPSHHKDKVIWVNPFYPEHPDFRRFVILYLDESEENFPRVTVISANRQLA
jgi:NAD-dependent oxidoreductase involved in siderophore biosynthesis